MAATPRATGKETPRPAPATPQDERRQEEGPRRAVGPEDEDRRTDAGASAGAAPETKPGGC